MSTYKAHRALRGVPCCRRLPGPETGTGQQAPKPLDNAWTEGARHARAADTAAATDLCTVCTILAMARTQRQIGAGDGCPKSAVCGSSLHARPGTQTNRALDRPRRCPQYRVVCLCRDESATRQSGLCERHSMHQTSVHAQAAPPAPSRLLQQLSASVDRRLVLLSDCMRVLRAQMAGLVVGTEQSAALTIIDPLPTRHKA